MEEIKKIEVQGQQYGVADMLMRSVMGGNAQVIEWSHTHNMNDYKDAGTYRIKGERTGNPLDDNLPIMNSGSGHTIDGVLYVLDSSLANGSGKESDCTITQFLMLSNRVGGQEGDMYMRSGFGATKDNLTWKPWEKYQTNMEVGCVADRQVLNPSNPTEVIVSRFQYCMNGLVDNGIYSGVYIPPKALVGTSASDGIKDPTAIETFVMVVINNYSAAGLARYVTQIKFAVTNGGVFSMEKRSTPPGSLDFSQWESVGGGTPTYIDYKNDSVILGTGIFGFNYVSICNGVTISDRTDASHEYSMLSIEKSYAGPISQLTIEATNHLNVDSSGLQVLNELHPESPISIGSGVAIFDVAIDASGGEVYFSKALEDAPFGSFIITTNGDGIDFVKEDHPCYMDRVIIKNNNTRLPYNLSDKGSDTIIINASDEKITFSYNGKTAELQLT